MSAVMSRKSTSVYTRRGAGTRPPVAVVALAPSTHVLDSSARATPTSGALSPSGHTDSTRSHSGSGRVVNRSHSHAPSAPQPPMSCSISVTVAAHRR
jgi:hypothetical protein